MSIYYENVLGRLYQGDCLEVVRGLADGSIDNCITSPPYWGLRSYLPDVVKLKSDTPEWVIKKLAENNISPIDHIAD